MSTSERIKIAFDTIYEAPLEVWQIFTDSGEVVQARKDEVLKANHSIEKYFYFILQGSGGVLLWNKNNFICMDVSCEYEILCDYTSFLTQQPTPIEVILFEDSELLRISKAKYDDLTKTSIGAVISRACTEALYIHKQHQQIDILTKTAKERYQDLQAKQPNLLQKIPQKYIASFLGVTPQSLSRIRGEIAQTLAAEAR